MRKKHLLACREDFMDVLSRGNLERFEKYMAFHPYIVHEKSLQDRLWTSVLLRCLRPWPMMRSLLAYGADVHLPDLIRYMKYDVVPFDVFQAFVDAHVRWRCNPPLHKVYTKTGMSGYTILHLIIKGRAAEDDETKKAMIDHVMLRGYDIDASFGKKNSAIDCAWARYDWGITLHLLSHGARYDTLSCICTERCCHHQLKEDHLYPRIHIIHFLHAEKKQRKLVLPTELWRMLLSYILEDDELPPLSPSYS